MIKHLLPAPRDRLLAAVTGSRASAPRAGQIAAGRPTPRVLGAGTALPCSAGFSLLEGLMALSLAAAVAAWLLGGAPHALQRAAEARARSDLALLQTALAAYGREFAEYPRVAGLPAVSHADGDAIASGSAEEAVREALLGRLNPSLQPVRARAWITPGAVAELGIGATVGVDTGRPRGGLAAEARGVFADPWGRPYRYAGASAGRGPRWYSTGGDGEDGPAGDPRAEDNLDAPF